jgi:hypothetical protein
MYQILMQAKTPISHGDPGAGAVGNASPFRLQPILYRRNLNGIMIKADEGDIDTLRARKIEEAEKAIRDLASQFPLDPDSPIAAALQELNAEEFAASALIYALIKELNNLNGGEGEGLFEGIKRYNMLLSRVAIATSSTANSLFRLYSELLNQLKITSALNGLKDLLPYFFALPRVIQVGIIRCLATDSHSIIEGIARPWFDLEKTRAKAQRDGGMFTPLNYYYDPAGRVQGSSMEFAEASIPHVSENAFRHSVFRATLFNHLLSELDLGDISNVVKERLLPDWVTMLFSNGGNVQGGAQIPDNSAAINFAVKQTFPSMDLLSGCVPTHIMGDGRLSLAAYTLCVQNNEYTLPLGFSSDVDAATLLYEVTHTRQVPEGMEKSKEAGQMLSSYTAMKRGSQILLTVNFSPFSPELTRGAAYFAVGEWLKSGGEIAGRGNTGNGQMQLLESRAVEGLWQDDAPELLAEKYQEYIHANRERLRDELTSGRLGWSKKLS